MIETSPSLRHHRALQRAHDARARAAADLWHRLTTPRRAALTRR